MLAVYAQTLADLLSKAHREKKDFHASYRIFSSKLYGGKNYSLALAIKTAKSSVRLTNATEPAGECP